MNKIIFIAAVCFLSACSSVKFKSPDYVSSVETTSILQALGVGNIDVKSVISSTDIDYSCPSGSSTILLPNNSSFEDYIKNAFIEELSSAKIYDPKTPKITLKVEIKELEYFLSHNSLLSVWDIDLKIYSSNGTSLRVHEHHLFDAGAYSRWNCQKIASEYMPAIQAIILELAKAPKLKALLTPLQVIPEKQPAVTKPNSDPLKEAPAP